MHTTTNRFEWRCLRIWILDTCLIGLLLGAGTLNAQALRSALVSWTPSPSAGVAGYVLQYGTASGHYSVYTNVAGATSVTVGGLQAATTYYFVVSAYTSAGLTSAPSQEVTCEVPAAMQGTFPTVTIGSPSNGSVVSGVTTISVQATDDVGIAKVECYLNGNLEGISTSVPAVFAWDTTSFPNGSYVLQAKAYDIAGSVSVSGSVTVTVANVVADLTAPVVQVTSPAQGTTVAGAVAIGVVASDNIAVAKVECYLNGALEAETSSLPAQFTWNTQIYPNGAYLIQAKAYDAVGNSTTSAGVTAWVQNQVADTTAPTVDLVAPDDATTVSGVVSVQLTAVDNVGVTRLEWYLNGTLSGTSATTPASFSWDTRNLANASYRLEARAYDAAGNVGVSSTSTVTVLNTPPDTSAPLVQITTPANNTKVSKTIKITVTCTDNVGVTRLELLVDGKLDQTVVPTSSTASFNWNPAKVARGTHTLQVLAYDAAGNRGTSSIVTVTK